MSYRLDYLEPIPKVVERLEGEHLEFGHKLERIKTTKNTKVAISLLALLKPEILRHAIEEEARLVRTIMKESKSESTESITVMQEHRRITEFLNDVMPHLQEIPEKKARKEIDEFVSEVQKHHAEEEKIVFPLALSSDSKECRR